VVNRPRANSLTHVASTGGTIRSLPLYLQQEEDVDEDEHVAELVPIAEDDYSSSNSSSSGRSRSDESDMLDLVHKENIRLRRLSQQKYQYELTSAQNTIDHLQRMTERFQKLLLPTEARAVKRSRRQSTGVTMLWDHQDEMKYSYERKLQILLDEMDAMEFEENKLYEQLIQKKQENEKLNRKLKFKDDIIRQLVYELQFERGAHSNS
jgi:hypothetical protein